MSKSKIANSSTLKTKFYTLDFTNIIEPSSTDNIATRELGIIGAEKFQNCKFDNCNCSKRK
jgi:hypothetical protein